MKRIAALFFLLLACYSVYHDVTYGTLPAAGNEIPTSIPEENSTDYFKKKIEAGDTVLSIVEDTFTGSMEVPISQVIQDFQELNSGMDPVMIQIGETYKFPAYSGSE